MCLPETKMLGKRNEVNNTFSSGSLGRAAELMLTGHTAHAWQAVSRG